MAVLLRVRQITGSNLSPQFGCAESFIHSRQCSISSPRSLQPAILLVGQLQPDAAPFHVDGALDSLTAFEIQPVAAALRDFKQSFQAQEVQPNGNRRFQILFEELGVPSALGLKRHVDATGRRS